MMRKLKRNIARNFMARIGLKRVNRHISSSWREYLAEAVEFFGRRTKRTVRGR